MVSKILHIACIVLLGILAIVLCVNSISALCSDYEKTEFLVTGTYQDHTSGGKMAAYLQGLHNDEPLIPENALFTNDDIRPGDTVEVWYSPSSNQIDPGYMGRIITNFISAAVSIACIVFAFPRKSQESGAQPVHSKSKKNKKK